MKLAFTGAGGGHFYPLMAVADSVRKELFVQKLTSPEFYFFSDAKYDEKALNDLGMQYIHIPSGKLHVFFSPEIVVNVFNLFWGTIVAIYKLFSIYPDVLFAKGGYASFPVIIAAKFLSIPIIIHESDTVAGRVTKFADKLAYRVAIAQKEAAPFFKNKNLALVGIPIRDSILPKEGFVRSLPEGRRPVVLITCGSQGSMKINDAVLQALPKLLEQYDVVHQTGEKQFQEISSITTSMLKDNEYKDRYYVAPFIDLGVFYGKVDVAVMRAGSTTLFETALWRLPQIVIPIPQTVSRDQVSNAYAFFNKGSAVVIEEANLSSTSILAELSRILTDKTLYQKMSDAGREVEYSRTASNVIAKEMLKIALSHYE
jgi:UDP-N-acetylglucosamine--N-acetylmuramyl-(pentapeptide) pyrophosphoryl-undecaprenol N-acetylglucosamine transferase